MQRFLFPFIWHVKHSAHCFIDTNITELESKYGFEHTDIQRNDFHFQKFWARNSIYIPSRATFFLQFWN